MIDADYNGNVGVILINNSDSEFRVEAEMRTAQLILEKHVNPRIVEIDTDFTPTERGGQASSSLRM